MGIIFTFLMGLFMSFESITDNDYFWHVVIGRWIDTNHAIPNRPLFSWWGMQSDLSWTSHEWLTEWIMYKLGDAGCIAIMLIIFFLLYVLMAKLLKVKFNKIFDVKLIYLLLMTIFFKVTGPRPYIISLLFFAYLLYVLFGYLDNKKKFNKLIWTLPIMQVLWANLHGGSSSLPYVFIIGILLSDLFIKIFGSNLYYIFDRIFNWSSGSGLQLENAMAAIGSAGMFGHGFNKTPIYFPEAGTDFIFAVFASNFGLFGCFLLISLLVFLDTKIILYAQRKITDTDRYILIGIASMLVFQQIQNIGMTVGLLPITGITLPFISYGGSSLLSYMIIVGILINISMEKPIKYRYK